jgi:arylsulfatase A-like enzyme
MMNDYYTHLRNGNNFMRENKNVINPVGHATDLFAQWAVDYIGSQKNSTHPFFLYLAFNAPHSPVQPPAEWLAKVKAREKGISDTRANLVALIEHLDDGIGKVIQSLKNSGKFENTLIVFMSDNGGLISNGSNNGDLRGTKTGMYEGGIRIPACISWPKHIAPNSSNNEKVISMDIFPTIIDIIGIKNNSTIDGVSLLPLLTAKSVTNKPRNLFFTMRDGGIKMGGQTTQALISGDWKILQNTPFQPYELYNLKSDPSEQHNLADIEVKKFQELLKEMVQHIKEGGKVPWQE